MKLVILSAPIVAASLLLAFARDAPDGHEHIAPDREPFGIVFAAEVTRVIDGDTVVVTPVRAPVTVRLLDCWAPESRTKNLAEKAKGQSSASHLARMATGKEVKVFLPVSPGESLGQSLTFGRVLGHVYLKDGRSLAEEQVSAGHATTHKE